MIAHKVQAKFKPQQPSMWLRVLHCADLGADNYKDDFHATADQANLDDLVISGCVYTDANQVREHPASKLISAIANNKLLCANDIAETDCLGIDVPLSHEDNAFEDDPPLVTYQSNGHAAPLNDWEDPSFFPAAFPTLFPFGVGGHLSSSRKTRISIAAWAKWALNHHSRRSVLSIKLLYYY